MTGASNYSKFSQQGNKVYVIYNYIVTAFGKIIFMPTR